eukprot:CAMPEP_0197073802 /NCGR_PEP_ID=MMETSP1384-20130603/210791_1 /TAXON_ID=29189 /ORGANISM="Ammonia sp." /LENGTH=337 /DNA_ID=CAMNT_0042512643 /DNA_START=147 /DNA_END=1161 /DNA_ORIENTATION=-
MANGNEKDKEKCHRCGNLGHWARDCQQPRNNANGNEKKHGKKINYSEKYVKKLSAEEEAKLDAARIQEFAEKLVNTESDTLHVYVDGYNIIGVDRACRDFMYKSKQKQKARQRIAELIQHSFVEKVKLNYKVAFTNGNEKKHGKKINYNEKYVKKLSAEEEAKLDAARIQEFAEKLVNTESDTLHVYVDGYNIIGVDRACRDFMYKSKEKQKARQRIAELIQHSFVEKVKLNYKVVVHLYFDGHIDKEYTKQLVLDEQLVAVYKDIEIVHTTVECVVDDRLVADFSKVAKEQNGDKLVITSDRELTIRLHDIGVASMKSGVFYKAYLAENHDQIDQK